jgi:hypothetical protein
MRLINTTNLGLRLLLSLMWILNAFSQQVHARGGEDIEYTSLSKRGVIFVHNQTRQESGTTGIDGILNPGFENGPDGSWIEYSAKGWPLLLNEAELLQGITPHNGQWAAWLGGDYNEISYISQTVAITTEASTLRFWEWIVSEDTCNHDFGKILINNIVVSTFNLCAATNTNGWVNETVDLVTYVGQNVELKFYTETDSALDSNLFLDDITLGIINTPTATRTSTPTSTNSPTFTTTSTHTNTPTATRTSTPTSTNSPTFTTTSTPIYTNTPNRQSHPIYLPLVVR